MNKLLFVTIFLGIFNLHKPSFGQFFSGNTLLERCNADFNYCQGYVVGLADAIEDLTNWGQIKNCQIKLTAGITGKQLADIFIKYLREHPEERHYTAGSIIISRLKEVFPCSKK